MDTRKTSQLKPNPLNPRGAVVEDDALRELAASIREQGLLQPVLITPQNLIVAGHRRVAACVLAAVHEIPVIVKELDEAAQIEIMLVENLQRQELNPLQIGKAALELRRRGLTVTTICGAIGISAQTLKNYLTIAQFPKELQTFFANGQLKMITVSALEELSPKQQIYWANRAVNSEWGGAQLCKAIRSRERGKAELVSDDDIRQETLSGIADKLFKIADSVDYYDDLKPIAVQINLCGNSIIEALRKGKPRRVA